MKFRHLNTAVIGQQESAVVVEVLDAFDRAFAGVMVRVRAATAEGEPIEVPGTFSSYLGITGADGRISFDLPFAVGTPLLVDALLPEGLTEAFLVVTGEEREFLRIRSDRDFQAISISTIPVPFEAPYLVPSLEPAPEKEEAPKLPAPVPVQPVDEVEPFLRPQEPEPAPPEIMPAPAVPVSEDLQIQLPPPEETPSFLLEGIGMGVGGAGVIAGLAFREPVVAIVGGGVGLVSLVSTLVKLFG